MIEVKDGVGEYRLLRCLLDTGDMTSFISENAIKKLELDIISCSVKGLPQWPFNFLSVA